MNTDKLEAYLKYVSKQLAILHGVILFDDDKEYAKQKSIKNTEELELALRLEFIKNFEMEEPK